MSIFRNYEYYKEEIELALIQNACVEIELYSIIASMIRESKNPYKLSVRDVSARRRSEISERFHGKAGFPDFVLLKREKIVNADICGCIEAKMPSVLFEDAYGQLEGHMQSFQKVLFTNGIRWVFMDGSMENISFDVTLGTMCNGKIFWNTEDKWRILLGEIDSIAWYQK